MSVVGDFDDGFAPGITTNTKGDMTDTFNLIKRGVEGGVLEGVAGGVRGG